MIFDGFQALDQKQIDVQEYKDKFKQIQVKYERLQNEVSQQKDQANVMNIKYRQVLGQKENEAQNCENKYKQLEIQYKRLQSEKLEMEQNAAIDRSTTQKLKDVEIALCI